MIGRIWTTAALVAMLAPAQDPHAHRQSPPTLVEGGWSVYRHKTAGFTFEHPAAWSVVSEKAGVSIHISHPTKAVHLFAAAFTMQEGTLQGFAEQKFAVQREMFKPLGRARGGDGCGRRGRLEEGEAAGGDRKARRRPLRQPRAGLFASRSLYVRPRDVAGHDGDDVRFLSSLRFDERTYDPPAPL